MFTDRAQHVRLPKQTPGATWIQCWKPVWVKLAWFWQPAIVKLQVQAAPNQPWILQIDTAGTHRDEQVGCAVTIYYDPQFVRPLVLPDPPEPPGEPDF